MKKILVQEGKHGEEVWDASTPQLEERAFRELFRYMKDDLEYYTELEEATVETGCDHECNHHDKVDMSNEEREQQYQIDLYHKAKRGDLKAIKELLNARKDYEYEYWEIREVR